ncbi:MAG TPA: MFS transporter [Ktedonobacterales bacterium]|nr:MFS transporter [Ktedonobacterales bacterium]
MDFKESSSSASDARRGTGLNWSAFYQILILSIFLAPAFDNMDQATCSFILNMMRMDWNLTAFTASYMPAFALLGTCLGAIFWGMVADRIGRRQALIWTILLFSATNLVQTQAWSFPQFTITCFFMGFGVGGEIPLAFTLLSEFLPARIRTQAGLVIGILAIVGGYALSAASAYILLQVLHADWRTLFYVQALPALLVVAIRFKLPESPRYLRATGREEAALAVAAEVEHRTGTYNPLAETEANLHIETTRLSPLASLRTIWQNIYFRRTIGNWLFGFCIGFFEFGFIIWLPTTLKNLGFSDAKSIGYPLLLNLFALPSALLALYLLRRGGTRLILTLYPLIAGILTVALGYFLLQAAQQPLALILLGGGIFFFGTTLLGIFPIYSSEVYPTEVRGAGSGWAAGLTRVGSFLGPLVGGLMFDLTIASRYQLMFFGTFLLIGAVLMGLVGIQTYKQTLEQLSPSLAAKESAAGD